jgi:Tfp pilus assembly protein PilO
MKIHLNTEKKTLITLSIFSIVTMAIIFGIIFPTFKYIQNLEEETGQLREYLEKKYENTRTIRTSKKKIDEIESIVSHYPNFLFYRGDELKLITSLENLANSNKVTQKIDNSNLDKFGDYINLSLTINGDYQNILKYLAALESGNYYFTITNLQLSSAFSPQNNNANATIMNLDLILYVN